MAVHTFAEVRAHFAAHSKNTWERLHYVSDSYRTRGALAPMRFGEETITDLMLMELYLLGSSLIQFSQPSKQQEARSGTDFELWVGSARLGWFRFAIQAKRLYAKSKCYDKLHHSNAHGNQIDSLENFADSNRAASLYCMYNYTEDVKQREHWRCCTGSFEHHEFGCTVTPSSTIRDVLDSGDKKTFGRVHCAENTLPLRCLVSCPAVKSGLEFMASGPSKSQQPDYSPLFDPKACYYPSLPGILGPNSGINRIRDNENGGVLLSVQIGEDGEIVDPEGQITQSARGDSRETYIQGSGWPKAAAVLEVQASN